MVPKSASGQKQGRAVGRDLISNYERGVMLPRPAVLSILAKALGVVGLTSHYCLTNAFRSGDASVVVPLDFLRIPLIALVGWMFTSTPSMNLP